MEKEKQEFREWTDDEVDEDELKHAVEDRRNGFRI